MRASTVKPKDTKKGKIVQVDSSLHAVLSVRSHQILLSPLFKSLSY